MANPRVELPAQWPPPGETGGIVIHPLRGWTGYMGGIVTTGVTVANSIHPRPGVGGIWVVPDPTGVTVAIVIDRLRRSVI